MSLVITLPTANQSMLRVRMASIVRAANSYVALVRVMGIMESIIMSPSKSVGLCQRRPASWRCSDMALQIAMRLLPSTGRSSIVKRASMGALRLASL